MIIFESVPRQSLPILYGLACALIMQAGCGLMRQAKKPKVVMPDLPPLTDKTCNRLELSLKPRIIGWPASTRQLIEGRLKKGALGVRYVKNGCKVQLIPQPACQLGVNYNYNRVYAQRDLLINSSGGLWQELPTVAKKYSKAISSRRSIKIFAETSAVLSLPDNSGVHERKLSSRQCKNVTHIVSSVALGRLAIVEGEESKVEDYTGRLMPKAPLSMVEFSGDSQACKNMKLIRPPECRSPIRFVLQPVRISEKALSSKRVSFPASTFLRGDSQVRIQLDAYEMDQNEASASEYDECVRARKCTPAKQGAFCTSGIIGKEDHPINCIEWRQARAFCRYKEMRLPTEAEWENAARSSDGRRFVWGDEWPPPSRLGNFADVGTKSAYPYWGRIEGYEDGFVGTAPVKSFRSKATPSGLINMAGNVAVWVEDWYEKKQSRRSARNPKGPRRGKTKVVRGSSFGHHKEADFYTYNRDFYMPRTSSMHIGVRCAR